MAIAQREQKSRLTSRLKNAGWSFDFFHAVRTLERLFPNKTPVGFEGPPAREAVHFNPSDSFAFQAGAIRSITPSPEESADIPAQMETTFFGLYGRNGVLPWHYTNRIKDDLRKNSDDSTRAFIDIFNHRLLSYFARAGSKYRIPHRYTMRLRNQVEEMLLAFVGISERTTPIPSDLPSTIIIRYSGLLLQPRSAAGLKTILSDFFQLPFEIEQFIGEWLPIETEDQCSLGRKNSHMGKSLTCGRRVYSAQHKYRIIIGPVPFSTFLEFLPGEQGTDVLDMLTGLYMPEMAYEICHRVIRATVAPCVLGGSRTQIGRSSWLQARDSSGERIHFRPAELHHLFKRKAATTVP